MRSIVPVTAVCLLLPAFGLACIWDYDTLKMEQARFPDTLELITGKFLRHSPEFYRWRIADRLKRLEADPTNVQLLDDLAVAYDKVGEHDKAIETAERTERIKPGRYETAANLGSFLFHAGRLKDGLPHIDRALAINPNAHFGREKYQKLLVEYVLKQRTVRTIRSFRLPLPLADCTLHPLEPDERPQESGVMDVQIENTFRDFTSPRRWEFELDDYTPAGAAAVMRGETAAGIYSLLPELRHSAQKSKTSTAIRGVLGMMKFGDHRSPVLLEALGSLLSDDVNGDDFDAKNLACRAFLKASYEVPDGPSRTAYRAMAKRAISMQTGGKFDSQITLKEVEAEFQSELADARKWYEAVREKELAAIRESKNPEAEFDKLYEPEPQVIGGDVPKADNWATRNAVLIGGVGLTTLVAGWLVVARVRRLRTTTVQSSNP